MPIREDLNARLRHLNLTGPAAEAALRLVFDDAAVPVPALAPVRDGTWHEKSLAGYTGTPKLNGAAVILDLTPVGHQDPFADFQGAERVLNKPGSFRLTDGTTLESDCVQPVSWGTGGVRLDLHHWRWSTKASKCWIGDIEGVRFRSGNLSLATEDGSLRRTDAHNLYLRGQLDWLIVGNDGVSTVAIEARVTV